MKTKNKIWVGMFLLALLFFAGGVHGEDEVLYTSSSFSGSYSGSSYVNYQNPGSFGSVYSSSDLNTYWPALNQDPASCEARQDLILAIPPAGCEPAVVRSDLLAEQNVPVFCQIDAVQINPLINIREIKNVRFLGEQGPEIAGTGFHPARSALRSRDRLLGSPIVNNIGYAVVILKRNEVESSLPDFVEVNLSANIEYDSDGALGIGRSRFILEPTTDEEWRNFGEEEKNSFWQGRYFVRLEELDSNFATVSIYSGDNKISTSRIERGGSGGEIFVPGFYCQAGLEVFFDDLEVAEDKARIIISDSDGTDSFDVYEGSSFFDNRCTVTNLEVENDGTGEARIRCRSSSVTLKLGSFQFKVGNDVNYTVTGEKVRIVGLTEDNRYEINVSDGFGNNLIVDFENLEGITGVDYERELTLVDEDLTGKTKAKNYLDIAIEEYKQVAELYPFERDVQGSISYGEEALVKAITLALSLNQDLTARNLLETLEEQYQNSKSIEEFKRRIGLVGGIDRRDDSAFIEFDNRFREVRLASLEKARNDSSVDLIIGSNQETGSTKLTNLAIGESGGSSTGISIRIDDINAGDVHVGYDCDGGNDYRRAIVRLGETRDVCDDLDGFIRLDDLDITSSAEIRIEPSIRGSGSEVPLNVKIGIEKRAIDLSPEKTEDLIEDLNDTIEDIVEINENLGELVAGWKAACLATGAGLTVKSFLDGVVNGGAVQARQDVLQGESGWKDWCTKNRGDDTMSECLSKYSGSLSTDIDAQQNAIAKTNNVINEIDNSADCLVDSGGFFSSATVDRECAANKLRDKMFSEFGSTQFDFDGDGSVERVDSYFANLDYANGDASYEELRELYTLLELRRSGGYTSDVGFNRMNNRTLTIGKNIGIKLEFSNSASLYDGLVSAGQIGDVQDATYLSGGRSVGGSVEKLDTNKYAFSGSVSHGMFINVGNSNLKKTKIDAGVYGLGLERAPGSVNEYLIEEVYKVNSDGTTEVVDAGDFKRAFGVSKVVSDATYQNNYVDPKVHYYETDPYKGMPAIVPIDVASGWYVAARQSIPAFGNVKAYEESGRPSSFWICNVGANGRPDVLIGVGDDQGCTQINLDSGQALNKISGLSENKARDLVNKAVIGLGQAADQYRDGVTRVVINGESFEVGTPATDNPGTECEDFMSPGDCSLLYNVCDPVICPSSRCNLGGRYHVPDVVQSGIIGSALLCLPNFGLPSDGGVVVPVCLTGIHAGLDNYVSILESHRQCLEESLETGRSVGICDQIYSIYLCDLFWRQAEPLADLAVPFVAGAVTGENQRKGGGEYLNVQAAWENAQGSFDYLTQSYGANALDAFRARSQDSVTGSAAFCKSFVSASAPDTFETLIEPDSPPQVYAWFSETEFSDVTVPATGQYKVFYHIFAGNDAGVQYTVYLKGAPESSFFSLSSTLQVPEGFGFIPRGEFASETKDFTAPRGYRELCVRVNDRDYCGFGQATTDFGLNFVKDSLVQDELTKTGITSENACVSGGLSGSALLNPNVQAGAEDLFASQNERGIVRVCAQDNPGLTTDPSRFVDVGYCGDTQIRCWLDERSVSNAISDGNQGAQADTLEELGNNAEASLFGPGTLTPGGANYEIYEIVDDVSRLKSVALGDIEAEAATLLEEITKLLPQIVLNYQKAQLEFLEGEINEIVSREFYKPGSAADAETVSNSGSVPSEQAEEVLTPIGDFSFSELNNPLDYTLQPRDDSGIVEIHYEGRWTDIYVTNRRDFFALASDTGNYVNVGSTNGESQLTFDVRTPGRFSTEILVHLDSLNGIYVDYDNNRFYQSEPVAPNPPALLETSRALTFDTETFSLTKGTFLIHEETGEGSPFYIWIDTKGGDTVHISADQVCENTEGDLINPTVADIVDGKVDVDFVITISDSYDPCIKEKYPDYGPLLDALHGKKVDFENGRIEY